MKTKSNSLSNVICRRIRYVAAISLMLIAVLLTRYTAVANARRAGAQEATSAADVSPAESDNDAEYLEKRSEFLERFFGTGPEGVSPGAYESALAAARALPPSQLLQGRRLMSPETLQAATAWSSPIPPPIQQSYGGDASARVQALAVDPINPNVVYTGSFGGLAKTTDAGVTWRYLSDAWGSQSVSTIAIDPNAHGFVYVGTGSDGYGPYGLGLYRSFDGGATWIGPLGSNEFKGTYLRAIAVDPRTSGSQTRTIVYAANGLSGNSGLWRSVDSGVNWTRVRQAGHNGIHDLAIDPSTFPSTVYITEDGGTFKSTNLGASWTFIHGILAGSRNRLRAVNSTLYLLGPGDPDHNLYKSMDRGATWVQIPTRCPAGAHSCANVNSIGIGVFDVDPFNPGVILGGNMALYRSDNEGITWTEVEPWWGINIHTDQRVIAFSRTAPGIAYDGNDGGVVKSTNDGRQWTNLNQNFPGALMYSVALSADGSMIAGTQDNGTVYSNLGTPWYAFRDGDSNHDLIDPIGSTWAYKVSYGRNSFSRFNRNIKPYHFDNISPAQFSSDGGCNFFPTFSMNASLPTHVIAACQQVVRTVNAPTVTTASWTTIGPSLADPNRPPTAYGNYVTAAYQAPSNTNVIYAVRGWDTVFVTANADQGNGAIWTQVTQPNQPGGISAITVDPTNYQTAYLACNSGVYKTTDLGTTWTQQIPQPIQSLIYHDVAIDPANAQHIFAASNAGVFVSTDGGTTWDNISNGIPVGMAVTALSFNAISRHLAASTFGRGVYILNLNASPTAMNSSAD